MKTKIWVRVVALLLIVLLLWWLYMALLWEADEAFTHLTPTVEVIQSLNNV